jgi:hypothetical protein
VAPNSVPTFTLVPAIPLPKNFTRNVQRGSTDAPQYAAVSGYPFGGDQRMGWCPMRPSSLTNRCGCRIVGAHVRITEHARWNGRFSFGSEGAGIPSTVAADRTSRTVARMSAPLAR